MNRMLACTLSAFAGSFASAQSMDLRVDDRILVGFGSTESIGGNFDFGSDQQEPFVPFETWTGFAGGGAGTAGGDASMDSAISNTLITATGSASAGASFDSLENSLVSALGSSSHAIGFSLTETTTFSLIATLNATGTARAFARLSEGLFFGDAIFEAETNGGLLEVNETVLLGPGDYKIQFFANSNITLFADGNATGQSSFAGSFAVVPAAPTLAMLGLSGVLASRRRR